MFGALFNTEKVIAETIQNHLEELSHELGLPHDKLFVMIKPVDEKFNMAFYLYRTDGGAPQYVRHIKLSEIIGS